MTEINDLAGESLEASDVEQWLSQTQADAESLARLVELVESARQNRDRSMLIAVQVGATITAVAGAAGVTRQAVYDAIARASMNRARIGVV